MKIFEAPATDARQITGANRWTRPHRVFLTLALIFGSALALLTPPYQVPDEQDHFLHAYQVSEGHFIGHWEDGIGRCDLPLSIYLSTKPFADARYNVATISFSTLREAMRIPLKPDVRVKFMLEMEHYPPLVYLPQAVGIALGRIFEAPPLALLYLGRLFNLWTWTALGYLALRVAGGYARPLLALMLMPMSLFMAASLSADATVNALAFLVVALAFRAAVRPAMGDARFIGWPWVVAFILATAALTPTKAAYLPLAGLILCAGVKRLGGAKKFTVILVILLMANVIPLLLWTRRTPGLDTVVYIGNPLVSARRQLQFLHSHPLSLVTIPIATARANGLDMLWQLVGRLGWCNVQVYPPFVIAYLVALILLCRPVSNEPPLHKPLRVWLIATLAAGGCIEAILMLLYLTWAEVGADRVDGLQGRYFIPVAAALLLAISALWRTGPARFRSARNLASGNLIVALIALFSCAYTLALVYVHYFVSISVGSI